MNNNNNNKKTTEFKLKSESNPTPGKHGKVMFLVRKGQFFRQIRRQKKHVWLKETKGVCVLRLRSANWGLQSVCVSCLSVSRLCHWLFSQMWGFIKPFTKANKPAMCLCECARSLTDAPCLCTYLFVIYWDGSEVSLARIIRIYESLCAVSGRPESSPHTDTHSRTNWVWSWLSRSSIKGLFSRSFVTTHINTHCKNC